MAGNLSVGSAVYFNKDDKAFVKEEITRPAKISIIVDDLVLVFPIYKVNTTPINPKTKAKAWMDRVESDRSMPITAPRLEAELTPKMSGVAKGFEKTP